MIVFLGCDRMTLMSRTVSGLVVIAVLISAPAFAADMVVKAPPAPAAPPVPSWEGFYLGADVGYAIGIADVSAPIQSNTSLPNVFPNPSTSGFGADLLPPMSGIRTSAVIREVAPDVSTT